MFARPSLSATQLPAKLNLAEPTYRFGFDGGCGKQNASRAENAAYLRDGEFRPWQVFENMETNDHVHGMICHRQALIEVAFKDLVIADPLKASGIGSPIEANPASIDMVPNEDTRYPLAAPHVQDRQGLPARPLLILQAFERMPITGRPQGITSPQCLGAKASIQSQPSRSVTKAPQFTAQQSPTSADASTRPADESGQKSAFGR